MKRNNINIRIQKKSKIQGEDKANIVNQTALKCLTVPGLSAGVETIAEGMHISP